jgi:hypothetical protein
LLIDYKNNYCEYFLFVALAANPWVKSETKLL